MVLYIVETDDPRIVRYLDKKYNVVKIMVIVDVKDHRPLNALSKKDSSVRIKRVQELLVFNIPR